MQGHYGTRFLNMWKTGQVLPDGNDAGVVNAMNHWSEKLGGYVDRPDVIKKVLESLPIEPPSLPQFMELMRHAWTPPAVPMLENSRGTGAEQETGAGGNGKNPCINGRKNSWTSWRLSTAESTN